MRHLRKFDYYSNRIIKNYLPSIAERITNLDTIHFKGKLWKAGWKETIRKYFGKGLYI